MTSRLPPAGWYADPRVPGQQRLWDGSAWTASVQPAVQPSVQPSSAHRVSAPAPTVGRRSRRIFLATGLLMIAAALAELGLLVAGLAVVAAVVLLPLYAWAALSLDRLHPEPRTTLVWTFMAGATAVAFAAYVVNSVFIVLLVETLGNDTVALVGEAVSAPVVEEVGKAAVLLVLYRRFRHHISGPLDGIVYATMVGLGFATVENVLYYGRAVAQGDFAVVFVLRGVLSPFAHPVFTACTGIGLGLLASGRTRRRFAAPALGLLQAVVLHALWNGSSALGGYGFFLVFFGVMVPVFVGLIVVGRKEARREKRTIVDHLRPEVAAGVLTDADVHALSDVRARRRLIRTARRLHPRAGAAARELAADAIELATTRERISRDAFSPDYGVPQDTVDMLRARLERARWELPSAPSGAPGAGILGGLGLPVSAVWPDRLG